MFNMRLDALSSGGAGMSRINHSRRATGSSAVIVRNNSVDEGVIAFGLWLNTGERRDSAIPIVMEHFDQGKAVLLADNVLHKEVTVQITDGVPFCNHCGSDDCAHVGFTICAEQMHRRSRLE